MDFFTVSWKSIQITWVSQKFCNILVIWDTIWQIQMLLAKVVKLMNYTVLGNAGSSDTLQMLHTGFACEAWSTDLESKVLCLTLPDHIKVIVTQAKFLEPSGSTALSPFT